MRYKKILLICPQFNKGRFRLSLNPLAGIGYIAESLLAAGLDVRVFDMNLRHSYRGLRKRISDFNPDIIGFTAMTFGYKDLYATIARIKKEYPLVKIVAGGPHISTLREEAMRECPSIDYGIILEGERSMTGLCMGADVGKIPGFIHRKGNEVITNSFYDFIKDLDKVPFPRYGSFELDKYPTRQIGIVTSRGCPYDCIYCPVATAIGRQYRQRSAQSVADEIEYWYRKDYRELLLLDDNFTLSRERVTQICDLISGKNLKGISLKCPNGVRADKVDRELLKTMRQAGFDMLSFGVEAAEDRVLRNIHKSENIAIIEKSIHDACDLGFDVDLFFLIGSPGECFSDVRSSFSLAMRYPIRNAKFYNLIPFPATELCKWITDNNYFLRSMEDIMNNASHFINEPCFFTPEMSADDRRKAFRIGESVSRNIRRKFIERKIGGPLSFRRFFSWAYTLKFAEWALINSVLFVRLKEKLKKIDICAYKSVFAKKAKKAAFLFTRRPGRLLKVITARIRSLPKFAVCRRIKGVVFAFDFDYDPAISNMYNGIYEMDTIDAMKIFLKKGSTFIDVGANIGYISAVAMGLVGHLGQVHSFEPVPEYFGRLKNMAAANNKYMITVNQFALADEEGALKIAVTNLRNIGWNTIVPALMPKETVKDMVEVRTCRLDSYIRDKKLENISLIKIDTEGFEFPVLKGLRGYFETSKKKAPLICEVGPRAYPFLGCTLVQLKEYMAQYGYRAFSLNNFDAEVDITGLKETSNVIFIHEQGRCSAGIGS